MRVKLFNEINDTGGSCDDFHYGEVEDYSVFIAKGDQTIADFVPVSGSGFETTDAVVLSATALSGLDVAFAVESGPGTISGDTNLTFTGAGEVVVVASQTGDVNWNPAPDVTNTFTVGKTAAQVFLLDLAQTYDGMAKHVTATTMPAGLTVEFTYGGHAWAPTNAGSYAVTGTVNDAIYQGSATGTLVVAKADQTISFAPIAPQPWTATNELVATSTSGLAVELAVVDGPGILATPLSPATLTYPDAGDVVVVASQIGDGNWNAAPEVTNVVKVFRVMPDNGPLSGGNAVTVTNGHFGTITNVYLGTPGSSPATLPDSAESGFTMLPPTAAHAGTVDVVVQTSDHGDIVLVGAYTYNPAGVIDSVTPASGSRVGGYPVVISGLNLCDQDPSDLTDITLAGVSVEEIVSATPTQIVVRAGPAPTPGIGNVRVFSISHGETVKIDGFAYAPLIFTNAPVPVPEEWLIEFGITNDFENALFDDPDGNGVPTWMEYVMDTNPTNPASFLGAVEAFNEYGEPSWQVVGTNADPPYDVWTQTFWSVTGQILSWPASTNRVYDLYSAPSPQGPWTVVPEFTNMVPVTPKITVTVNYDAAEYRKYWRLGVRLP